MHRKGRHLQIIEELEVAWGLRSFLDGLAQDHSTGAPISPVGGAHGIKRTRSLGHCADEVQLGLSVRPAGGIGNIVGTADNKEDDTVYPLGFLCLSLRHLLKSIDSHHHRHAKVLSVLNLLPHVAAALLQQLQVLNTGRSILWLTCLLGIMKLFSYYCRTLI